MRPHPTHSPPITRHSSLAAYVAMELSWVSLVFGLAWVGWGGGQWPLPFVALLPGPLGTIAALVTPWPWRRRRWYDVYRWALALSLAVLCGRLAELSAGGIWFDARFAVAVVGGFILFWRGWLIGEDEPDARGVETGFQVGAIAVLPLMALLQWSAPGAGQVPAVAFFLFGLLAIGLARRGERRAERADLEPDWLLLTILLGVATLLAAGLLVVLVSPELLQAVGDQLAWLGSLIGWLLAGLFSGATAPPAPEGRAVPNLGIGTPQAVPIGETPPPPWWLTWTFERLADLALILLFGYAIYRLVHFGLRRMRGRAGDVPAGEAPRTEIVPFSWSRWWRELLARLFGWLRPRRTQGPRHGAEDAPPATREQRSVREIYREFLKTTTRLGFARATSETPSEFAAHLAVRRPRATPHLAELTGLYVRVRYAEERVDRHEVSAMRSAVERVTAALRDDPNGAGAGRRS
jgi:hypothetical protein